jgi:dihydroxyacetone kinase
LARLSDHNVIVRSDIDSVRDKQVALISGGGSGHEPAHAGYVGAGMLTAAVAGEVFTSPSADSVYAAIKAATGAPGALLIVKNYTGDRLNFGLAAEMARAEGIQVEMVVVADDVATASMKETAGRRGIAGTVLVHKIAGAAAAAGKSLEEVHRIASEAANSVSTMGLSLLPGTVPAVGKPNFVLGDDEIELGLGIHGEPGVKRMALASSDKLVEILVDAICTLSQPRSGERAVLLINNLGATTVMELAIVARHALSVLDRRGIRIERSYAGTFMSSLETAGVSLSLLPVDDNRLDWLDADTEAPAWPRTQPQRANGVRVTTSAHYTQEHPTTSQPSALSGSGRMLQRAIQAACQALRSGEDKLTRLDQAVGDGDLGLSMLRGAEAVDLLMHSCNFDDPVRTLRVMSAALQRAMAGSSGPLYGVLLLKAANTLQDRGSNAPEDWGHALADGCGAISELGGAKAGDRTMLDALIPFEQEFLRALTDGSPWRTALGFAASAAEEGAKATARMLPRRGRSSYIGERSLGYADPGAEAAALWLRAVTNALSAET